MKTGLLRRVRDVIELLGIYLYELIVSSVVVARAAFARSPNMQSSIIAVPIELRTDLGVAVLASLVSLTPGNCALHASADRRLLYVHALDGRAPEQIIASIRHVFERRIARIERW
ncbi:sodium:proton antiporter [Stutzerimonas stutzeri]|uniref:Sodium:proton antiporter n=1 Tax=Stutzerimonas stutzeri TaxID=316 RepID=A0A2S4AIZ7_STUST|nr:Na+/H+ antiporter subunit E [Stutzerimonas stutzeri]MCQ4265218.1 Na+/H+ antiporter subunit E [Stutzerimonas stutzeri]POH81436.1 sodium:proton antiporter [Stutzerimonas stutzeri]